MSQTFAPLLIQRLAFLSQIWQSRSQREQRILRLAGVLLLLTGLWMLAIAPAWKTWRNAPEKTAQLQTELLAVQALAAQAQSLQASPRIPFDQRRQTLADLTQQTLGASARLTVQDGRTLVTLEAVPAARLAAWLAAVREGAQWQPNQARLRPPTAMSTAPSDTSAMASTTDGPLWSGEVVFEHPR